MPSPADGGTSVVTIAELQDCRVARLPSCKIAELQAGALVAGTAMGAGYRSRYSCRAIRITSEREMCVLATYSSRRASKVSGRRTCRALECTPGALREGRPR